MSGDFFKASLREALSKSPAAGEAPSSVSRKFWLSDGTQSASGTLDTQIKKMASQIASIKEEKLLKDLQIENPDEILASPSYPINSRSGRIAENLSSLVDSNAIAGADLAMEKAEANSKYSEALDLLCKNGQLKKEPVLVSYISEESGSKHYKRPGDLALPKLSPVEMEVRVDQEKGKLQISTAVHLSMAENVILKRFKPCTTMVTIELPLSDLEKSDDAFARCRITEFKRSDVFFLRESPTESRGGEAKAS